MNPIIPHESSYPEIEPPTKRQRIADTKTVFSIEILTDEIFVQIAHFSKPKDIYRSLAITNKVFLRIAVEYLEKSIYQKWWLEHFKSSFPDSYAALPKNIKEHPETKWHEIYKQEFRVKWNMICGRYAFSFLNYTPQLSSLNQSEHLLIIQSTASVQGWNLENKQTIKVFEENFVFSTYTFHENVLYAFLGDNTIRIFNVSSNKCDTNHEIQPIPIPTPQGVNPLPFQLAQVHWPYLLGFTETSLFIWNLEAKPTKSINIELEQKDYIGIYKSQVVFYKKSKVVSHNIVTLEEKTCFFLEDYSFSKIHMYQACLVACHSKPEYRVLIYNLLTHSPILIPLPLVEPPKETFIYDNHFYCWDKNAGVLAKLCLNTLQIQDIPELTLKKWKNRKKKHETDDTNKFRIKLINGLVFTRTHVTDLAKNIKSDIGSTRCPHLHYLLDYTKTAYFNGILIRGYPCTNNDTDNIEVLDFANPPIEVVSVETMDISS